MQKNVKAITRKYEEDLIKLNVEVFRSIENYDNYAVSSFGRVKNVKTDKILKAGLGKRGYFIVVLSDKEHRRKTRNIHRLVTNAFIDNPNDKKCVDHKDNNRTNNRLTNLRWATTKENAMNQIISKNNTSGAKGISWHKQTKKWRARINIDGIEIYIGLFDNIEDAKTARINRANEGFGIYTNACEKL